MTARFGAPAGILAICGLLAGCVPVKWPARQESPQPVAVIPRPAPAPVPAPAPPKTPSRPAPPPATVPSAGNPPFYEVLGERYFVIQSSEGYRETGVASWYGEPFHGRRTSNGDVYDMHSFTAAHKTLPLPSLVRVTNLDNGRSVLVRVNDRGPFVKNRLIDLSYAAATELGIVKTGTGPVDVEALGSTSGVRASVLPDRTANRGSAGTLNAAPARVPLESLFMQVGAFSDESNATRLKTSLESNGVNKVVIRYDDVTSPALYRVRIGPIDGSAEFDALASRVGTLRIAKPQLVTESPVTPGSPPVP